VCENEDGGSKKKEFGRGFYSARHALDWTDWISSTKDGTNNDGSDSGCGGFGKGFLPLADFVGHYVSGLGGKKKERRKLR
jgi:hypothetical protein